MNPNAVTKCLSYLEFTAYVSFRGKVIIDNEFERYLAHYLGKMDKKSDTNGFATVLNGAGRKEVFEKFKFDPTLGMGEDLWVARQMKRARVSHSVTEECIIGYHVPHNIQEWISQKQWYARILLKWFKYRKIYGEKINPEALFLRGLLNNFINVIFPLIWIPILLIYPNLFILILLGPLYFVHFFVYGEKQRILKNYYIFLALNGLIDCSLIRPS